MNSSTLYTPSLQVEAGLSKTRGKCCFQGQGNVKIQISWFEKMSGKMDVDYIYRTHNTISE